MGGVLSVERVERVSVSLSLSLSLGVLVLVGRLVGLTVTELVICRCQGLVPSKRHLRRFVWPRTGVQLPGGMRPWWGL